MAAPEFVNASTGGVNQGNSAVSVPAPSGVTAADYQIVALGVVSTSANVGTTPSGFSLLGNYSVDSGGSISSTRMALYAGFGSTDAFAMTLTSGRVWGAIRGAWRQPVGADAPTVFDVALEAVSTNTSHPLPSVATAAADSVIVGVGVNETSSTAQSWDVGALTLRGNFNAMNTVERIWLTTGETVRATPGTGSPGTFTTSTAGRSMLASIVIPGTGSAAFNTTRFLPFFQ